MRYIRRAGALALLPLPVSLLLRRCYTTTTTAAAATTTTITATTITTAAAFSAATAAAATTTTTTSRRAACSRLIARLSGFPSFGLVPSRWAGVSFAAWLSTSRVASCTKRDFHHPRRHDYLQASMAQTVELKAPNGVEICLPTGLFIANEFVKSQEGKTITSVSPINGKEICKVEAASAADIDRAVGAARAAFENASWRQMPGSERSGLLLRLASLIEAKTHTLATLETWDNGKPFSVSRDLDLPEAISCLRYYAGWADKLQGQTIPAQDPSKKLAYTLRQPVGVCAQIIPWNYPLAMAAWKLGPALAAGCTIVLKPAEQTPLSVLLLADLVRQAGFPAGVFNVVNGLGREAGAALAAHTGVDKIAFTGSTATGRQVMKMAAVNLKNMTLETGGKSPLLVFADAHIEQAARWACIGVMSNQGQVCSSTARILVEQSIIKDFTRAFVAAVQDMVKMGDPFSEQTTHGPQVSQQQHDAIMKHIAGATAQGAKLELGGASAQKTSGTNGFFVEPTVLSGVSGDMAVFADEIFGPVATLTPFGSEAEALTLANASEYGLAAAVFSASVERVHRVAARLEAGMVWVNSTNDSEVQIPFGGVKQSGVGRELGEAGLWAYTEIKAVHVNLGHIV